MHAEGLFGGLGADHPVCTHFLWRLQLPANMPELASPVVLELAQGAAGEAIYRQRSASSSSECTRLLENATVQNCCCRAVVAAGATPRGVARAKAGRGVAVVVVVVAVVVGVGVAVCSGSSSSSSSSSNASSKVSPAISRSGRSRKNCASSRPQGSARAMGSANTTSQSHLNTAGIPAQASSIGVSQAWLAAMLHGNRAPPETQPGDGVPWLREWYRQLPSPGWRMTRAFLQRAEGTS